MCCLMKLAGGGWLAGGLLGQDQLAPTRNLQTVDLTLVFDVDTLSALEQLATAQYRTACSRTRLPKFPVVDLVLHRSPAFSTASVLQLKKTILMRVIRFYHCFAITQARARHIVMRVCKRGALSGALERPSTSHTGMDIDEKVAEPTWRSPSSLACGVRLAHTSTPHGRRALGGPARQLVIRLLGDAAERVFGRPQLGAQRLS